MSRADFSVELRPVRLGQVAFDGRYIIISAVVAMWIVALILIRITPPVYESTAVYATGPWLAKAKEMRKVESAREVLSWLRENFSVERDGEPIGDTPYLYSLKIYADDWEWIVLAARARSAAESHDFLAGVLDALLSRHQEIYELSLHQARAEAAVVEGKVQELRRQTMLEESRIERLFTSDPAQAVVATLQQSELFVQYEEKRNELRQLKLQGVEEAHMRSKVLIEPSLPLESIPPDYAMLLSAATILGLVIGWVGAVATRWPTGADAKAVGVDAPTRGY